MTLRASSCLSLDAFVAASNWWMKSMVWCTMCSCAAEFSFRSCPIAAMTSSRALFKLPCTSENLAFSAANFCSRSARSCAHCAVRTSFSAWMRSFSSSKLWLSPFRKAASCSSRSSTCLARFSLCSCSFSRMGPVSACVCARDSSRSLSMSALSPAVVSSTAPERPLSPSKSLVYAFRQPFFLWARLLSNSLAKSLRRSTRALERPSVSARISDSRSRISLFHCS
mmetsp:Transcript_32148/g.81816  ORF Transcript_32148/g.81816 Transcript_32148/m.81816 type:complete len:225 (+) Transcript_32148:118-792(+)